MYYTSKRMKEFVYISPSTEATETFAESIGQKLRGGEIIELIGDVGAGKTSFVRGLARGAGSKDRVSSPTFTVSQVYESGNITIHHYDFYRLDDLAIIQSELAEVISQDKTAVVLEWAGEVQDVLPEDHITLKIETTGENERKFMSAIPEKFQYLEINP